MSAQRKPALIGGFILSGIALIIAFTFVLSKDMFIRSVDYVVFFTGTLEGLDVGADVTYRGVRVGAVKEIRLDYDEKRHEVVMPVIIQLYSHKQDKEQVIQKNLMHTLIEEGLKAQIQSASLITGKSHIVLDTYKDTEGYINKRNNTGYPAIPSIPSHVEQIANIMAEALDELKQLPVRELIDNLSRSVAALERITNSRELQSSLTSLDKTLANLDQLTTTLNAKLDPLIVNLGTTTSEFKLTAVKIQEAASSMNKGLQDISLLARDLHGSLGPHSEVQYELAGAIQNMVDAAKSIQRLAESINHHPESLIFGRKGE